MLLTINGGSSSIKFALYETGLSLTCTLRGEVKGINTLNAKCIFSYTGTAEQTENIGSSDYNSAINFLLGWLEKRNCFAGVKAVGHRVVHGMQRTEPAVATDELLLELKAITFYDPEHLPWEIKLIEAFGKRYPDLTQVACFDTSFHNTMPAVAKLLPIPRRYHAQGIQRYGFHGLSYTYLMEELKRVAGHETAQGKVILAHLGSGASIAAVKNGKSMDTSMGFTPASGLTMSTRTGDIDPGVMLYLMRADKLNIKQLGNLVNHQSGLLGISETSADMQTLLESQHNDNRAAEAVELFCYQTKKWIGSFTAVLGGLDTLVFAGGIGENSPEIRNRVCSNLQFSGIEIDKAKNEKNEPVISTNQSKVTVRVIATNEELMIAKLVCRLMNYTIDK